MFANITSGEDVRHLIGKPIEIRVLFNVNAGKPSSSQWDEEHTSVGILVGTYDKRVKGVVVETGIILQGGGGMHSDRRIELKWQANTDLNSAAYEEVTA